MLKESRLYYKQLSLKKILPFVQLQGNCAIASPKDQLYEQMTSNPAFTEKNTAISRKVVGKMCTRQSRKVGYDQYTVSDDFTCGTYFCCFPLALENTFPRHFVPILSNFFKEQ